MSSPSSPGGNNGSVAIREGTRVILREITGNLHNSPPGQSPRRKSGNETASIKGEQQHDVKVRFIREFADAGASGRDANTESSLSSASSFQSLTSTLSSKCSSGICVDSNPAKACDTSYLNADIPGLDDLISACENICLNDKTLDLSKDQSYSLHLDGEDLSGDQTFTSADDRDSLDRTRDLSAPSSPVNFPPDVTQELDSTRSVNEETETSVVNAFFECVTVDIVEATQNLEANLELGSVSETFVQCVSNLAQVDPAVDGNARDNLDDVELAKTEETHEELEILGENKTDNDLRVSKIDSVENSTCSLDEFAGESTVALESISNLINDDAALRLKEIESVGTTRRSEVADKPTQSLLDVTVDVPSDLKEIDGIEPSDFDEKVPIPSESLPDLVVDDISSVDSLECYKPLIPVLSELNESSQCPSLPTLSSICLQATFTETGSLLAKDPVKNVQNTEDIISTIAVPSLSEKFANIAANDVSPNNSISTIKEPTFLNAQKLVEDSIEFIEDVSAVKTEDAVPRVENIEEISNLETVKNIENPIGPSQIEFCEFKTPEPPVARAATKVVSPVPPEIEESQIETVNKIEVEEQITTEIVDCHKADCSAGSDDLDDTVTIQDLSAGNIFAVPESDQYAEFLPQQQSTALTLQRVPPVNLNKSCSVAGARLISGDNLVSKPISLPDEYAAFLPQQQSTALTCFVDRPLCKLERQPTPFVTASLPPIEGQFNGENKKSPKPTLSIDDRCNFEKLELAAKAVASDIYNTSLELEDENSGRFVSASSELFYDPGGFDFLLSKTPRKNSHRDLRAESLYVKFDPLVSNTSMLPQGNIQNTSPPRNEEERNGDNNTTVATIGTPKRNPAIAAIDRLLFYSPMTTPTPTTNTATIQKTNDSHEKVEPTEETSAETVNMAKELELVRSTVIQLEEQVEKLKIDHEQALEKQSSYQEKIKQLQTQLAQEIKNKNQITVVVDEYEKSISRLVAERERDRKNLDLEKAKLQEELVAAKHHLDNTESAFNDVHLKYERLKVVVANYKTNEAALKQSVQENVEIIKSLENRYEQVKEHATARLEKANQDLDSIRKQNESETVRLHAMLRKAELKSNSLAELVEQKTKENKELTQILDEVIARVGLNKSE